MRTTATALLCAGSIVAATAAHAQEAASAGQPAEGFGGNDIVVTARRVEERLQDVPLAITAISGDALTERGATQVIELRQVVPGLNLNPAAGRSTSVIYALRGQRAVDIAVTQDASVAVYMDDIIVAPLQGGNLGMFDLESVQVLRGPQGTLFGRNSTGGAVLFTTVKPKADFGGYAKVGYGNYDAKTLQGALNIPINDSIRLRGAADYTKRDGFGRVVAGPSIGTGTEVQPSVGRYVRSRDELNLRFSAAIDPVDGIETLTTFYHSRADNGAPSHRILVAPLNSPYVADAARLASYGRYDIESNDADILGERVRLYGVNNTVKIQLSDNLTFKNIFGFRHLKLRERADFDGSEKPIQLSNNDANVKQYSEEAQLQGDAFDNRLNFVFGVYYYLQKGTDGSNGGRTFAGTPNSTGGPVRNASFSGYGQGTYALTDTLNFTAGMRYTVDRRRYTVISRAGTLENPGNCLIPGGTNDNCGLTGIVSYSRPTWTLSLDKKLGSDALVYAAHRRGYRSGGFNLRGTTPGTQGPFSPEIVDDVEVGAKTTWRVGSDWTLKANVAGYYQWYKDIQRAVTGLINGQLGNTILNAAGAHIYGGEAEFDLSSRFAGLSVNYAYVKPEYTDFPVLGTINGVAGQPLNRKDLQFVYIPRHQLSANLRVSPDVGDFGKLNLFANLYYQSKIYFSEEFQTRAQLLQALNDAGDANLPDKLALGQKGYALVNLRAELNDIAGSGLSAAIFANNVFDKRYLASGNVFYASLGINQGVYGDPATYGAELTFRF